MNKLLKNKKQIIIFLGSQGSGKGTQADFLGKELNIPVIEMGKLLRKESLKNSTTGKKIREIMNKGKLLPVPITTNILRDELKKINIQEGFILDGFPRNLEQAKEIEKFKNKTIIFLSLSKKETIKRLSKRKTCDNCGKVFIARDNLKRCLTCGGKLRQREDDKPAAIKERLETFEKLTKPVFRYYKEKSELVDINGEQSIDKVFKEILKKLGMNK